MYRLLFTIATLVLSMADIAASELQNLRVNRMQAPSGIVRTGQFSWQIVSEENNVRQIAYYIKVASTKEGLQGGPTMMWDSERRESADQVQVYYQGRRFPYDSTVYWQLEVWLSNNEHLQSPVQEFRTGSRGTVWNGRPVTQAEERHDYLYYLRWLRTLMISQAGNGELFQPVAEEEEHAIPAERAAAVLYSLYKEEGDMKAVYDYYDMVRRWVDYLYEKDSTVSSRLIEMVTEMAQCQNRQADVTALRRLRTDTTAYAPFWLYTGEEEWCGGAIRQADSGIAYNRTEITIPCPDGKPRGQITHECPYGTISSEWSRGEDNAIMWNIRIPVGVQAILVYPGGYTDEGGDTTSVIGSGQWEVRLIPDSGSR